MVLLSLIAFSSVFGFAGALLALPLAAIVQLLVSRVVLSTVEAGRQARARELKVQSLIEVSEELRQNIYETSNQNSAFQNLPEADRLEIYQLADDLNQVLQQVREVAESV
jgi:hypothetical protein